MTVKVLGLDSSLTAFGWAVLELERNRLHPLGYSESRFVDAGLIETEKDDGAENKSVDRTRRVQEIGLAVDQVLARYEPALAAVEGLALIPRMSPIVISSLARVRGVVEGLCLARRVRLIEVAPQTLKKFVTGDLHAPKEAVVEWARRAFYTSSALLDAVPASKRDNLADAVACASWGERRLREQYAPEVSA